MKELIQLAEASCVHPEKSAVFAHHDFRADPRHFFPDAPDARRSVHWRKSHFGGRQGSPLPEIRTRQTADHPVRPLLWEYSARRPRRFPAGQTPGSRYYQNGVPGVGGARSPVADFCFDSGLAARCCGCRKTRDCMGHNGHVPRLDRRFGAVVHHRRPAAVFSRPAALPGYGAADLSGNGLGARKQQDSSVVRSGVRQHGEHQPPDADEHARRAEPGLHKNGEGERPERQRNHLETRRAQCHYAGRYDYGPACGQRADGNLRH